MSTDPYAVDNASDVDNPWDTHPCGPVWPLSHSWVDGVCEDCGEVCEHEDQKYDDGRFWCVECEVLVREADREDFIDDYESYKDSVISEGGHWPPWRS